MAMGVELIGGRVTVCPIPCRLRDDGVMLQEVRAASNTRLNQRCDSPIWAAYRELTVTPPRGSNAAAARREIVGSGCGRSRKEDLFQVPAEVRLRPSGLSDCRAIGVGDVHYKT